MEELDPAKSDPRRDELRATTAERLLPAPAGVPGATGGLLPTAAAGRSLLPTAAATSLCHGATSTDHHSSRPREEERRRLLEELLSLHPLYGPVLLVL